MPQSSSAYPEHTSVTIIMTVQMVEMKQPAVSQPMSLIIIIIVLSLPCIHVLFDISFAVIFSSASHRSF